jgi:hypothetical protein
MPSYEISGAVFEKLNACDRINRNSGHGLLTPLKGVLCSVPPFEGDKYLETD